MAFVNKQWIAGYGFAVPESKYSNSIFQECCKIHGIRIAKDTIIMIVDNKEITCKFYSLLKKGSKYGPPKISEFLQIIL